MFPARPPQPPSDGDPISALPFDGLAFESRIAWIFGSPRTGSTWLLRMLVHPLILANQPPGLKRKRGTQTPAMAEIVVPVNESQLPLHITPLRKLGWDAAEQPDPDQFLMNSRHVHRPSYVFSDAHGDVAWRWIRPMVLARFYSQAEAAVEALGAQDCVVVVKEPNGSHGAQRVMSLMPQAKLIFLMRDGRDVVDSSLTLHLPGGGRAHRGHGIHNDADRLRYVRRDSRLWVNRMNAVQRAYDAHDPGRRLKVRYEELRRNTLEELSRIVEFLGLNRTEEEVTAAVKAEAFEARAAKQEPSQRQGATPGEWRKSLRPGEQDVVEGIMGPKLAELGYK